MNDPRTQVLPTLHAFWHLLDNADWHYEMSDDPSCWRAGRDQFVTIGALARLGGEHYEELYVDFSTYMAEMCFRRPNRPEPVKPAKPVSPDPCKHPSCTLVERS